jgi:hypothetical protein
MAVLVGEGAKLVIVGFLFLGDPAVAAAVRGFVFRCLFVELLLLLLRPPPIQRGAL